jgi:hypothetical protein
MMDSLMNLMHANPCIIREKKRNKIAYALQLHQVFESRQRCRKSSSEVIFLQITAPAVEDCKITAPASSDKCGI